MHGQARSAEAGTSSTFLFLFAIRLALILFALATLSLRTTLPHQLMARYALAGYLLIAPNAAAILFRKRLLALLHRWRVLLGLDLAAAVVVLQLGGGWRSSYYGYTLTTVVLFTIIDGRRGAAVSALTLAAASLLKNPALDSASLDVFFTDSWDVRLGAGEFYLIAGFTAGYFRMLQDRLAALAAAKLAETRKLATAEEKARLSLELHDGAKQTIIAMVLRMSMLWKRLRSRQDEVASELRWLWVGMNHLQRELDQVMAALTAPPGTPQAACDAAAVLRDEAQIAETMTGFSWRVTVDPPGPCALSGPPSALRRFVGEAMMNAWKHSGAASGTVDLIHDGARAIVTVADQGKGFVLDRALGGSSTGLKSLQRRAEELGGRLRVETGMGQGCRVRLTLPLAESPPGEQ
jgi:signal transduction histidine kinase